MIYPENPITVGQILQRSIDRIMQQPKTADKYYKGTIRYKIYDHFGLDTDDVNAYKRIPFIEKNLLKHEWIPGFSSWFVLQRYENCQEKYKPYVTYITIEEDFEGSID